MKRGHVALLISVVVDFELLLTTCVHSRVQLPAIYHAKPFLHCQIMKLNTYRYHFIYLFFVLAHDGKSKSEAILATPASHH